MANIPVEKSSGAAWLPWLLGLLALVGLIWLATSLLGDDDDVVVADADDTAVVDVDPAVDANVVDGTEALTAAMLLAADNPSEFDGREVTLTGLRVMEVTGDQTFTVSPDGAAESMLVYLDQEMTPGADGIEGRYDVNPGQMVQIDGVVRMLSAEQASSWDVGSSNASGGDLYIHADVLDIDGAEVDTAEIDGNPVAE